MEMKINSEGLPYKEDWGARQKFWKKKSCFVGVYPLKEEVYMNLSEILESLKSD